MITAEKASCNDCWMCNFNHLFWDKMILELGSSDQCYNFFRDIKALVLVLDVGLVRVISYTYLAYSYLFI